jgi:hypothetical protein
MINEGKNSIDVLNHHNVAAGRRLKYGQGRLIKDIITGIFKGRKK